MPPRFGYPHKVNYDLTNSGTWQVLPNGDKLWQLNVICPGALSVNFCYDKFWLPEGGKFFVYSKDRKHSIGAFTYKNNKGDNINPRGFATGLVYGNDVVLEYYQPKDISSEAIISIEYVVHGYRFINVGGRGIGSSGSCQVNINCEEGKNWQCEKNSVAMIVVQGCRLCTGALINTTNYSQEPFFLTANHCITGLGDAMTNNELNNTTFYWKHEAPGCENTTTTPFITTSGAIILANNAASDFALFRLTEDPKELASFTPYYLGWDNSGDSGDPGVSIHHPSGDIKKISTVYSQPTSMTYGSNLHTYWRVFWDETPNGYGTQERGSSGSPLLTATHKVIGQLQGGYGYCSQPYLYSRYGKLNVSWNGYGNDSICRRLDCWLDSIGTGQQVLEGLLVVRDTMTIVTNQPHYGTILVINNGQLTIRNEVEIVGNGKVIIESGGKLIIDGGVFSNVELSFEAGASLEIKNGGVLIPRNHLIIPLGVEIKIEQGQIVLNDEDD